jgi:phage baseplate assembly protein gpV/phage protein D
MSSIVGLPDLTIEVGEAPVEAGDAGALEEVRVQQRLSLPTQCELAFVNPKGPLGEATALPRGEPLRVAVRDTSEPLFEGEITAVEHSYQPAHGHEVRLRGYDLLHRLRKRQPVRAHVQVSARELAQELVGDLGLSVETTEAGPLFVRLIQHDQSDLDLLIEVAERCGLYFTLRDDVLQLLTLEGLGEPIPLALGQELFEARIEVNGDPACRSVVASAWDPWRVERHEGRATEARVGRDTPAEFPPTQFGLTGERTLANEVAQDDHQAEAMAQAELDLRVAREVTLWGTAEGNPRLRPGVRVEIRGVAPPLSGCYVLTSVNHLISRRTGFVSELSTSPPPGRSRRPGATAAWGIVARVDDPEGLGRVRVSLPTYGNLETEWMGVLTVGAGKGKGLVALPDVGDRVLVLFAHHDPAQGLVLGGLYGPQSPPDSGVEGGAIRRYTLRTPGGQVVCLDDSRQAIRIASSGGSSIELSPEKTVIHSKVGLVIDAAGQALVIRAATVDFEKG